ncbi:MAG: universal stress protein [Desulfosalsimonadaceae bacterium]
MQMFHVFRNTPYGRETLLQTAYFCKKMDITPVVYIPAYAKFLLYMENDVIQVDLDDSYLHSPETAKAHVNAVMVELEMAPPRFFTPRHFSTPTLPDVPVSFNFMTCPKTISDLSAKRGSGSIGPRIRRIFKAAAFPVMIPPPVYKPFTRIAVMFGGSANAANAVRLAVRLHRLSGMPVSLYTAEEGRRGKRYYEKLIGKNALTGVFEQTVTDWHVFPQKDFIDNLYMVPHDALVIMGAYGHGLVRQLLFGSTLEIIQSTLPNSLLIVGPNYRGTM